ncbi:MAG: glutamate synthase large subunit [bacterium]|nr:glutamate synthase large subunit [bacterium]
MRKGQGYPTAQGLYDPRFEHDGCGIGFVVDVAGRSSQEIVRQALEVLVNLDHRGARGSEPDTGDGAGILLQIPHAFFMEECAENLFRLPDPGHYGLGMVFLPQNPQERAPCEKIIEETVREDNLAFLGWRDVPTRNSDLGQGARSLEPVIRQFFVGRRGDLATSLDFERRLYVCRRRMEQAVAGLKLQEEDLFYICSLSSRTVIYKGMLTPKQVESYYPDLSNPVVTSALALIHARFSTNTFPDWKRAHPYRMLAHNGEINTLRGNVNWMAARQALFASRHLGDDWARTMGVIDEAGSDSAMLDNGFEFLALSGRPLAHAMMMMIPEPWSNHSAMSDSKRAFYEYHACLMEPWDGPAAVIFTDGVRIGGVLDRNGLRPARYTVTKDGLVVLASETGVLPIAPETVSEHGRLHPGHMFLVDTKEGRIVTDEEIKETVAGRHPYRLWLHEHLIDLDNLPEPASPGPQEKEPRLSRLRAFGYTFEELRTVLAPMAHTGYEPVGSMGADIPLAVLSHQPQLLYAYFKQLFAQVTNPPIDSIREEIITSTITTLGAEGNLLHPQPQACHHVRLQTPIIDNGELEKLRQIKAPGFKAVTLPILFPASQRTAGLEAAFERLCEEADQAVRNGANLIILSDRGVNKDMAPIPALLAVAGLHHHMIRAGTRTLAGIVLESAEPRDVHQFALLIGYGAGAVNPYLAFEALDELIQQGLLAGVDHKDGVRNYIKAGTKGVVKTMSKMGISTIQSYRGAQIFEAVGLNREVIDRFFTWTASRIQGADLQTLVDEVLRRHWRAFAPRAEVGADLATGGKHLWRQGGEHHQMNPMAIHLVQTATRTGNYSMFREFSRLIDDQGERLATLRGLLAFKEPSRPVPLEEVEPVEGIVKRFKSGAMSYGSISKEAHEALAIAMNRLGARSNTGEGGEDPARFTPDSNGDNRNSAIKQVASGRFGVTSHYLVNATEIQIKMAQGSKPGEGGQLPGFKVYPEIARVRLSTPGVGLISPPPHHDIYSIEDLAELIHDLKNANHSARISVKLVAEVGVGTIAAGVAKAKADVVLISGHDGGTGASPLSSIHHAGLPWELGLAETHQTLLLNGLRDRIAVETDGQLKTGRDVVVAALLGAEEFGFASTPLVVLGCIMMRVCHSNTCPVGIATQDPDLRAKFRGSPDHLVNYFTFVAREVREWMAQLGFRRFEEMIGRTDRLEMRRGIEHYKAKGVDLSPMLHQPAIPADAGQFCRVKQDHGLAKSLDQTVLLKVCEPALTRGEEVHATLPISNTSRVVGTQVGSEISRRYGPAGLPDNTIRLKFAGTGGQSFGAFAPRGLTLIIEGSANDYLGKGLSGGRIIVYPPRKATYVPGENILVGNVAFYGATGGEAYVRGMAGERFCVRNSGVRAVVAAVGDHGCEYMTGGVVVILGRTGRNFAAGMSGGLAYVYDEEGNFKDRCNLEMVDLFPLEREEEITEVREMIEKHRVLTGSERAEELLSSWTDTVSRFVKVFPRDYRRMLTAMERVAAQGLTGDRALAAAFEENTQDRARVGGN